MPLGFEHHNHSACISDTLQRAEVHCREANLNLRQCGGGLWKFCCKNTAPSGPMIF